MTFRLVKHVNKDCKIIWFILILCVCLCLLINYLYKTRYNEFFNNTSSKSFNLGICSKNCCATQWPVPININEKSKRIPNNYVKTNLTCNNGITNSGCVCLSKETTQLLNNRGYVKQLPVSNGLLESDNRQSVWQLLDNKKDKPMVLGQTDQLTGKSNNIISGFIKDKTLKQSIIKTDNDIAFNYTIPINNNMIEWDNEKINDTLIKNSDSNKVNISKTDKLLKNPIGVNSLTSNIK